MDATEKSGRPPGARHLAIIGASYLQLPLIERAKEMGYTTHVFAWASGDAGELAADVFYPISIVEREAILAKCREIGICGIVSIASDLAMLTVNYVAERLGLPGNTMACTRVTTDKYAQRRALAEGGDPGPRFFPADMTPAGVSIRSAEDTAAAGVCIHAADLPYPVIVKPTDRSGSRGVTRVEDPAELAAAVSAACGESFAGRAIIEEYIEGAEYSLEGIAFRGRHRVLAMTRKETTGPPHFVETGHTQPAPVDPETYAHAAQVVQHAVETLGITCGATHSELRIDANGTPRIIEIGARMGGDCIGSDLVPLVTGFDYVGAVIAIATGEASMEKLRMDAGTGEEPPAEKLRMDAGIHTPAFVRYILGEQDEREMEAFREAHPDCFVRLAYLNRSLYGTPTDSSKRAGCYIAFCPKPEPLTQAGACPVHVIIPCYASESYLTSTVEGIEAAFARHPAYTCHLILINDGSPDGTYAVIRTLCAAHPRITGIDLARNYGQGMAKMAGLKYAVGGCGIVMDDDGQHDPEAIFALLAEIRRGQDLVYAQFPRMKEALWRRAAGRAQDIMMGLLTGKPRGLVITSFLAVSPRALRYLRRQTQYAASIGLMLFPHTRRVGAVPVEHRSRSSGGSRYTLGKLFRESVRMLRGSRAVYPADAVRVREVIGCQSHFRNSSSGSGFEK